jgi:hypothetical protein
MLKNNKKLKNSMAITGILSGKNNKGKSGERNTGEMSFLEHLRS